MILWSLARRTMQLQAVLPVILLAIGATAEPPAHKGAVRDRVAVIVHKTNPVSDLSPAQLRKILLGEETRWPNNKRITILLPPGREERTTVLRILLRMTNDDFVRHWISHVFQGEATSGPKTVSSPASILLLVAGVPAAVGFLDAADVPAADAGIKVLRVAGKAITENGYPLRR